MAAIRSKTALSMLTAAALVGAAAVAQAAPSTDPSILVFDQAAKGEEIKLSYVHLPKNGYVAIYATDSQGKATGEPLGSVSLKAGDHRDVAVKLSKTPSPGTALKAAMYEDTDNKPGLQKGADAAVWGEGRIPPENKFVIR